MKQLRINEREKMVLGTTAAWKRAVRESETIRRAPKSHVDLFEVSQMLSC